MFQLSELVTEYQKEKLTINQSIARLVTSILTRDIVRKKLFLSEARMKILQNKSNLRWFSSVKQADLG